MRQTDSGTERERASNEDALKISRPSPLRNQNAMICMKRRLRKIQLVLLESQLTCYLTSVIRMASR